MNNELYWISLQSIFGYGSNTIGKILNNVENVAILFDKSLTFKDVKFLGEDNFKKLKNYNCKKSQSIINYCSKNNIEIITPDNKKYPNLLKNIKNPPAVIYCRGDFPNFDEEVGIGMVGTRKSTMNSDIVAATLAYRIAQAGAIVISGGAMGIDTKCSQGALFAKRPSVIVRPCGIDNSYLSNLSDIRNKIQNCGAVISEVQPLDSVLKNAFIVRNRIISALSLGVVAIETPNRSGVNITINYALEYGKDIFVVPGDISDKNYAGSNKFLQDGANPIYSPCDVLNEYILDYPHKLNLDNARTPINEDDIYLKLQKKYSKKQSTAPIIKGEKSLSKKSLIGVVKNKFTKDNSKKCIIEKVKLKSLPFKADETTKQVYNCFDCEPIAMDYIINKSKLDANDVMFALTELEINDVITSLPGGRYEIK